MADHSRRRQKWPPSAHITPCAPGRHVRLMGEDPPKKVDAIFKGLRGAGPTTHSNVTAMHHRQNKGVL